MHPSVGGHASYDKLLSTKPFFTVLILPLYHYHQSQLTQKVPHHRHGDRSLVCFEHVSTSCQTTALERVVTMDLTWVGHVLLMCCDEYFSETDLHSKSGRLGGMARGETFDKRRKEIESYHIRVVANKLSPVERQQL